MRIALIGPFSGATLRTAFGLSESCGLPRGYCGGAPLMGALARTLSDRGHQIACISTDQREPLGRAEDVDRFEMGSAVAYFAGERRQGYRFANGHIGRALDFFSFERRGLLAAIRHFEPEMIHAHWTYEFAWAALDSKIPTVVTAHDAPAKVLRYMPDLYRVCRFLMAKQVIARVSLLTAVSPDLARELSTWVRGGLPIHVVANPLGKDQFELDRLPSDRSAPRLMMVLNGWNELKNGKSALRAFAASRARDPRLRLTCFGAGWAEEGPAQRWAQSAHLDMGVEFRGPRPHNEILDCMRSSEALVHPSRNEACSMVIAEAMSVGLPVVAGQGTGGVAWQLDDGRAGWLVDVRDPAQISVAIDALIRSPSRWSEVSAAARARALALFEVDCVVDQYEQLYRHLFAPNHEGRGPGCVGARVLSDDALRGGRCGGDAHPLRTGAVGRETDVRYRER
jgi:glycosyltransferase involved in cell wall biosynthesis